MLSLYIHHPQRLNLGSTSCIPPPSGILISVVCHGTHLVSPFIPRHLRTDIVKLIDLFFDPVLLCSWMEGHRTGVTRGQGFSASTILFLLPLSIPSYVSKRAGKRKEVHSQAKRNAIL